MGVRVERSIVVMNDVSGVGAYIHLIELVTMRMLFYTWVSTVLVLWTVH